MLIYLKAQSVGISQTEMQLKEKSNVLLFKLRIKASYLILVLKPLGRAKSHCRWGADE